MAGKYEPYIPVSNYLQFCIKDRLGERISFVIWRLAVLQCIWRLAVLNYVFQMFFCTSPDLHKSKSCL